MAGDNERAGIEYTVHQEGYRRFLGWLKFGTIASALIAVLVVFLISR